MSLQVDLAPAVLEAEAEVLAPFLACWAEHVAPVRVLDLPDGGRALRFPPLPEDLDPGGRTRFRPIPGPLRGGAHRAVRDLLGFAQDDAHVLRTVPTPATLIARAAAADVPLAFVPRLILLDRDVVPPERWVRSLAEGVVPIHVPRPGLWQWADRALARPLRRFEWARGVLAGRLASVGHDLGKHVLLPRRLPARYLAAVRARLPAPGEPADWVAWTHFFEEVLPRACERLLGECRTPVEFDARAAEIPVGPDG